MAETDFNVSLATGVGVTSVQISEDQTNTEAFAEVVPGVGATAKGGKIEFALNARGALRNFPGAQTDTWRLAYDAEGGISFFKEKPFSLGLGASARQAEGFYSAADYLELQRRQTGSLSATFNPGGKDILLFSATAGWTHWENQTLTGLIQQHLPTVNLSADWNVFPATSLGLATEHVADWLETPHLTRIWLNAKSVFSVRTDPQNAQALLSKLNGQLKLGMAYEEVTARPFFVGQMGFYYRDGINWSLVLDSGPQLFPEGWRRRHQLSASLGKTFQEKLTITGSGEAQHLLPVGELSLLAVGMFDQLGGRLQAEWISKPQTRWVEKLTLEANAAYYARWQAGYFGIDQQPSTWWLSLNMSASR